VLDPFCGGGVTVVEALKLRRKAVGVDVNPVATYVTSMECADINLTEFKSAFEELSTRVADELSSLYRTTCRKCGANAIGDWFEWDEVSKRIVRVKLECPRCGSIEKKADEADQALANKVERQFGRIIGTRNLWFPRTPIPKGDKTTSLITRNLTSFHELFTRRNLLALAILRSEILNSKSGPARELLMFMFSSSLKWASRQSHLRGKIVEGWALHAYWIYPKSLELNVWNIFERRYDAVKRGKQYSQTHIGSYCKFAGKFEDLVKGATCLILSKSSSDLPLPDDTVDAVITDPPYGGNVNYAELSDFWHIWMSEGRTIEKEDEVVVNRTQQKSIEDYQALLESVFRECHRVLKPGRPFVSTFNSNDFRVVASFVVAGSKAGFTLVPEGVKYQAPIRPYMTTFHAMQIGAFVGDFIFTFKKEKAEPEQVFRQAELQRLCDEVSKLVDESVSSGRPEPKLREKAYGLLIPFLAKHAVSHSVQCEEAAEFFERKIAENNDYFKRTRKSETETRRSIFGSTARLPRS